MKARVMVCAEDGTERGVLPTIGLAFSLEVGGLGSVSFTATTTDMDGVGGWDALARVDVQPTGGGAWSAVAVYALRPPHTWERVGKPLVAVTGTTVIATWADETLVWPEYATTTMPRGAGTDRGIGWMMSAYDPGDDPTEPWTGCYNTSRTAMPPDFPTGSGAHWISVTDASDDAENKYFLGALVITAPTRVRCWFHGDESADVYIAGEAVLAWSGAESTWSGSPAVWDDPTAKVTLVMQPGVYRVGVRTQSVWSTGGDGVDPILLAVAAMGDDGGVDSWLLVSSEATFVACRRDDEPPDNEPPGPTPGQVLAALHAEAQERHATGWDNVTLGFSPDLDSYGHAWPARVVEREVRYGSDTYWAMWQSWADSDEVDVWMGPDLILRAAPVQGVDRTGTVTLGVTDVATMSANRSADPGSHVVALAMDGWIERSMAGPRREYGLEVGTAISRAVAGRVVAASLLENGRWDGSAHLAPLCPHIPGVAFGPGDRIGLDYPGAPTSARVLSLSARAGEGSLLWDLELVEVTG